MKCSKCGKEMEGKTIWLEGVFFGGFVPAYHCNNKKCSEYKSKKDLKEARKRRVK